MYTIYRKTARTIMIANEVHKELESRGEIIDLRDLFIAATCLAKDCQLLAFNKKHFEKINDLRLM
ncbi:MAG: type II toxin-antitoxin system VapC family toxin [Candidatus Aenigmarchaeota archaeon]|nr:type II toxin-antitoxin system VapC family toxin [Candidatus Aenigmarchaeota archaeon]